MMLPIFPLLFFVISIGSIFWYQRTDNDIFGVLAVASALTCLIWGLSIAHWLVHLVSLIILLGFGSPVFEAIHVKVNNK
ncbi:hypothetical protein [Cyanobacterium sp. uoEpiScrs1]|uniref:hypothetical protein n=1 Tax=Cyanobacterium sp. uoEpiScrs1 TaxID=2976343 RepID=UPI00226AC779|nr:hypothetical protein [Cyanobacterium sp. uoEpiScrs1]